MGFSVKVDHNDFARIAGELHERAAVAVEDTARDLEAGMKRRASSRVDKTVEIDRSVGDDLTVAVVAGDKSGAIHAGFEEFGTIGRAANPFAIPAAEAARSKFVANMRRALGG